MFLSTIWSIITMVIDVCIVWCMVYYILKNVKNNSKMILIVKGVVIIIIFRLLSEWLNLFFCDLEIFVFFIIEFY